MDTESENYIKSETGGYYVRKRGSLTSHEVLWVRSNSEKSVRNTIDWVRY